MKTPVPILMLVLAIAGCLFAAEDAIDPERAANTIILDEAGVKNLRIETVVAEPRDFETTVFAIGRIEEIPANRSVLSSRIAGRVVSLEAYAGDTVKKDQVLARVESRQPGDPPPTIELKAPRSGLIIDSHVRVGEPVEPEKDLLDISDRSRMWAIAKIPEKQAAGIVPGTKARIHIPALGDELFEAELMRYGVAADREAGTIEGIFELPNAEGRMQPGMRVEFSIITSTRSNVLAVPRSAVQGDPSKRVVFVEDFDLPNAYLRAPVVLGEQNDRYIEVIGGLLEGDDVVTRGSYSLSFAGGSGISLKEALDAAHGHEHNEDGSEITPEQRAAQAAAEAARQGGSATGSDLANLLLMIWAAVATGLFLIFLQLFLKKRKQAIA